MSTPILATKLYIPPTLTKAVLRPRLIERLNEGLKHYNRKLTLITAPAGFGKTTLVREWLTGCGRQVAWLSLDEGDNDPTRFLTYMVAALRTIAPDTGEGIIEVLQSPQPPPLEVILTTLLNEISALPFNFLLVLDDYHLVDAKPVDDILTFIVEHLPPQMHLVLTTREDPQLPLPRLRARGQLIELRASDLRFTTSEATEFLRQVMRLDLSEEDVATLEERTEGWIAGLQLAALSMQGHQDVAGFIRAFAGDHRYIVDYLVEEVLRRQSEVTRQFLLQTSILDRLNGPLCDAVTGQKGSTARLETLERGNFFVVGLDDTRHWYRYHHLFAEVLYAHLVADYPGRISTLHQSASKWYEHNGSTAEAIHHALAASNFERAADLVELAVPAMRRSRQEATLLGWLKALPDELFHCRPVLSVQYADALMLSGKFEGVEARLRDAERWLDTPTADVSGGERPQAPSTQANPEQSRRMIVVNEAEFRRLPGSIAVNRAGMALVRGDVSGTVKYARLALDRLPEEDHLGGGAAASLLGLAYWTSGNLEAGHRAYADGMARLQKAGHISDTMGCSIALADIRIAQGRLHEAITTYEHALQLAAEQGPNVLRGTADMYVGMSELHLEYNDLKAATQYLLRSKELGELAGLPQNPYRWCVAMARVREAEGDLDGALELLHHSERVYMSDFFPNVRPIAALKARVWLAQGRLGQALGWAREQGLSAGDELSYLYEFEHITLARVLLARYKSDQDEVNRFILEPLELLERLLRAAQAGERIGSLLEILVLQSLAHQLQGDIRAALEPLQRALMLAEPEGYMRMFVNEGAPMMVLLQEAAKRKIAPNYVRHLLTAFDKDEDRTSLKQQVLIEPLSARELEVLRLLRTELSGPEIARQLSVSLPTLRTHTNNIYLKLGMNNRRAAVRRAEELGLL